MTEQTGSSPAQLATEIFAALKEHDLDGMLAHTDLAAVDDFVAIGRFEGRENIRAFFTELLEAFPDFDIDVTNMVGDDRHAVLQWHATGTFEGGQFQGVHPTGRHVDLRGCDVMLFEGGKLTYDTIYYDGLAFARQIGMLPREGSSADKAMTAAFNAGTDLKTRIRTRREHMAKAG